MTVQPHLPEPLAAWMGPFLAGLTRRAGLGMLTSAHGCAALVPLDDPGGEDRAGPQAPFGIGACPFGTEGPELAARFA